MADQRDPNIENLDCALRMLRDPVTPEQRDLVYRQLVEVRERLLQTHRASVERLAETVSRAFTAQLEELRAQAIRLVNGPHR